MGKIKIDFAIFVRIYLAKEDKTEKQGAAGGLHALSPTQQ